MKFLLLAVIPFVLTGCWETTVQKADEIADAKIELSRTGLKAAEKQQCKIASVQAISEMYGQDAARWAAWCELCGHPKGLCDDFKTK